jgi:hypothetical protein
VSFLFCACSLLGLPVISMPSKPSAIPHDLFLFGVVEPSFFRDFARPRPSLRSWRANWSSVAAVRSAARAASIARSCFAAFSAFCFFRRAISSSWATLDFSYFERKMAASPLAAVSSVSKADSFSCSAARMFPCAGAAP